MRQSSTTLGVLQSVLKPAEAGLPLRDGVRLALGGRGAVGAAAFLAAALAADAGPSVAGPFPAEFELSKLREADGGDGTAGFIANGFCQAGTHGEPTCHRAAYAGYSLDAARDINGDGYDDVLIGAPAYYTSTRRAYVVFGSSQGFPAELDLHDLFADHDGDGSKGFVILPALPDFASSYLGRSVAGAGDVNGDGFDDLILGDAAGGRSFAGVAYVVFGSGDGFPAEFELSSLLAANGGDGHLGFTLNGAQPGDNTGTEVAGAGDINGDGFADLLVNTVPFGSPSSEFYVVFGSDQGFPPEFELADLFTANGGDGTKGVVLHGVDVSEVDRYGWHTVSSAGDVNGDGVDDLVVGIYRAPVGGQEDAGRAFVLFGSENGFPAELQLSSLIEENGGDGSAGFVINGVGEDSQTGHGVAAAGDVNADGIDDLVVTGRADGPTRRAWVIFGRREPFAAEFELSSLLAANGGNGSGGFVANEADGGYFNFNDLAGGGDVNGDGIDDLLLSSPSASPHRIDEAGRTYVLFGRDYGFPAELSVTALLPGRGGDGGSGFVIDGIAEGDFAGWTAAVGDVNGDGLDDILVGGDGVETYSYCCYTYVNAGATYVIFGRPNSLAGTAAGMDTRFAVCRNVSEAQTVIAPLLAPQPATSWDCERRGLDVSARDRVVVSLRGVSLPAALAGRVDRVKAGAATVCTDITTGATVQTELGPDGRWDCSAAGLPRANGDVVSVVVRGVAK